MGFHTSSRILVSGRCKIFLNNLTSHPQLMEKSEKGNILIYKKETCNNSNLNMPFGLFTTSWNMHRTSSRLSQNTARTVDLRFYFFSFGYVGTTKFLYLKINGTRDAVRKRKKGIKRDLLKNLLSMHSYKSKKIFIFGQEYYLNGYLLWAVLALYIQ